MAINIKCPNCGNINTDSLECRVCGQRFGDYSREDVVYEYHDEYHPSPENPKPPQKRRKKKRKSNRSVSYIVTIVILGLCLAIAVGTAVYFAKRSSVTSRRAEKEYSDVTTAKNDLTAENAELKDDIEELEKKNKTLEEEKSALEDEIDSMESKMEVLNDKSEFMDDHIVVVNENDGKKVYHKYGCSYFNDSEFWAYNNEQIRGKEGYSKCPHCIK